MGSTYGGKLNTQTVVGIADPSNYIELMKSAKWISTAVADKVATGLESITLPLSQGGQNNTSADSGNLLVESARKVYAFIPFSVKTMPESVPTYDEMKTKSKVFISS